MKQLCDSSLGISAIPFLRSSNQILLPGRPFLRSWDAEFATYATSDIHIPNKPALHWSFSESRELARCLPTWLRNSEYLVLRVDLLRKSYVKLRDRKSFFQRLNISCRFLWLYLLGFGHKATLPPALSPDWAPNLSVQSSIRQKKDPQLLKWYTLHSPIGY